MKCSLNSYFTKEQNPLLNSPYRLSPIHDEMLTDLECKVVKLAEIFKGDEENLKPIKAIYYRVKQLQKRKTSYNDKDKGTFVVIAENINNTRQWSTSHGFGKKLFNLGNKVKSISKKGFNKIGITCHNYFDANNFLFNSQLNSNSIISYIPQNCLTCKGILKNVSISIDEAHHYAHHLKLLKSVD